jgi:hypothetical protein
MLLRALTVASAVLASAAPATTLRAPAVTTAAAGEVAEPLALAGLLSGTWEMDPARSEFGPSPRASAMTRRMQVGRDALEMSITQTTPAGEMAGTFRCGIGGESCRNRQGSAETTGSARWEGSTLVVTTTLARLIGPDLTTIDRYQLSADRRTLTMERSFLAGGQASSAKGRLTFTRR